MTKLEKAKHERWRKEIILKYGRDFLLKAAEATRENQFKINSKLHKEFKNNTDDVERWLDAPNSKLGGVRPNFLIANGHEERLIEFLEGRNA